MCVFLRRRKPRTVLCLVRWSGQMCQKNFLFSFFSFCDLCFAVCAPTCPPGTSDGSKPRQELGQFRHLTTGGQVAVQFQRNRGQISLWYWLWRCCDVPWGQQLTTLITQSCFNYMSRFRYNSTAERKMSVIAFIGHPR
ncbi:uncharacterized protein CYBJADRAFT_51830 [Cyberlindnera jadinii NRRL Y-1542]|uniref:Uncharacterized protein n=1 Tax=Cyberlindnera jadinii (strain ATCC 18201 / CBS 1600 / BCRC 20928 / JCM 3617 / NBRC 0987 / NRRL Y-1542) TaxID=983966 RepID=A0A1E4RV15_CYBJN|nr:hypothetical protein CYBJADRAFT_51830 [Cyberlindnera jadinii NRRL Y-1542]ODV71119.1 hypothetical protein CYBJADRAFT_51830 [Cyberlindnera jadinii NRRL Y-1542]